VRFGSVLNTNYLDDKLRTPGVARTLDYVAAVFFSPSGGLFFTWTAAAVLASVACLLPLLTAPFGSAYARTALVVIGCVVALSIGFASWWTPFGWSGYGPRLQVPWVPPLILLSLVAYGDALGRLVGRFLARPWRLLLVFAVTLACALPSIGLLWDFSSLSGYFLQENPQCEAPWRSGVETWHSCQHRLLWEHRPMGLYTLEGVGTFGGVATAVVVAVGLLGCLILLREERAPSLSSSRRTTRALVAGSR
jgi:hypothetical protein